MFRRAVRYVSLRPYGDSLLAPAGAFWIFAVRIAILLMASAEAIAWSYAAFFLATGGLRWAVAAAAFLFTFVTVCLVDASLMTLDRWARWNDHRITSEPRPSWSNGALDVLSIGTRISLVALSIYITAPFLAQLMFTTDVERILHDERVAARASARQSLLTPIDARLRLLQTQLDERRGRLDAEVAGSGQSGKYGDGPAARQLRESVVAIGNEHAGLVDERVRLATEFDKLSDDAVSERFDVAMPGDSFAERARALGKNKTETYALTERAVQAFLVFLFVALLLLKLFEPRSVSIYFSERLQGLYRQYIGAVFDAHLDTAERADGAVPMTPLRFEDWALTTYPSIRAREAEALRARERFQFFANSVSELSAITAAVTAEESALHSELSIVDTQLQQATTDKSAAERAVAAADAQLPELETQRVTLENALKGPASAAALTAILATMTQLETSAAKLAADKAAAEARVDALTPLLVSLEERRADLLARLAHVSATRQRAETELAAVRLRHMSEISHAIAARWPEASGTTPGEVSILPPTQVEPKHVM